MLQYQKNKLINLILQFEIYFIDNKMQYPKIDHIKNLDAIHRNINGIKKLISKL